VALFEASRPLSITCKFCSSLLLASSTEIKRVLEMPVENWQELAASLCCHDELNELANRELGPRFGDLLVSRAAVMLHAENVESLSLGCRLNLQSVCILAFDSLLSPLKGVFHHVRGVVQPVHDDRGIRAVYRSWTPFLLHFSSIRCEGSLISNFQLLKYAIAVSSGSAAQPAEVVRLSETSPACSC
jgi:hypothetical protein